jgi:hypothetical protein
MMHLIFLHRLNVLKHNKLSKAAAKAEALDQAEATVGNKKQKKQRKKVAEVVAQIPTGTDIEGLIS